MPVVVYEPKTVTYFIHGTNLKLRSIRTLSSKAFDVLIDTILSLPHSSSVFFWRKQTSFFVRFTVWSNDNLEQILNILVLISNLNPTKGHIEMFTDEKIIYKTE